MIFLNHLAKPEITATSSVSYAGKIATAIKKVFSTRIHAS